jgi:DNA-binding XRE family transcriptional regulator
MNRKKKVSVPDDYPSRIFTLRRRLRLTQEHFAAHIGVSVGSVGGWEVGQSRPSRTAWCRMMRLSHSIQSPREEPMVKIIPDWQDKPLRINIVHIASYRQARETDFSMKPAYELFEYALLNMVGGHTHIAHMCVVEFDNMFAIDTRHYR